MPPFVARGDTHDNLDASRCEFRHGLHASDATRLVIELALVWALASGCSQDSEPGRQEIQERTPPTEAPFATRIELPTRGKPTAVAGFDLDGDGSDELYALTREPGGLHVWTAPTRASRFIALDEYCLGPVRIGACLAVVSQATRTLLSIDPTTNAIERSELPGVPRAFAAGPLFSDEDVLVIATRDGRLAFRLDGVWQAAELASSQVTFVAVESGRVLVGSQADETLRTYQWKEDAWQLTETVELGGIPRDYLAAAGREWIAAGDHDLWQRSAPGADFERLATAAIPIDLEALDDEHVLALAFYSLSYHVLRATRELARGYAGQDPWDACSADIDGDGLRELVFANRAARRVSVLFSRTDGSYEHDRRFTGGAGPSAVVCADLNGNGQPELVVIASKSSELVVHYDDATGGSRRYALAVEHVVPHDVDRDGRTDLIALVRTATGTALRVLFAGADGTLTADEQLADVELGPGSRDLWAGDLDDDGRLEVLVCDAVRGEVVLVAERRAERFGWQAPSALAVADAPRALTVFKRAAGMHEIAVALGEPGPRRGFALLAFDAQTGRLRETDFVAMDSWPLDIAWCAAPRAADGRLAVLAKPNQTDGAGVLDLFGWNADGSIEARSQHVTGLRPYGLDCGDFDGDGRDDIIVGTQNSHHVNLWRSSGTGLVQLPDLGAGIGILDVRFADWNGDGILDVVTANNFSDDASVLLGR